jgi:hypothetical protein
VKTFLRIDTIGGACPCQAEGTILDKPFYFRARHGGWTLDIAETLDMAIEGAIQPVAGSCTDVLYHAEGDDDTHGYLPIEDAAIIIASHAALYLHQVYAKKG